MTQQQNNFTCRKCETTQTYIRDKDYLFKCEVCGRDYEVKNGSLITRADLYDGTNQWRVNEKSPSPKDGFDFPIILKLIAGLFIIGAFILLVNFITSKRHSIRQAIAVQRTAKKRNERISKPSTYQQPLPKNDMETGEQITPNENLITLNKAVVDENFNHGIQFTITNTYDKPISNVQVYLDYNGNYSIPDNIAEDSKDLYNINTETLQPHQSKTFSITALSKSAEILDYAIVVRKVRFSDGTLEKP